MKSFFSYFINLCQLLIEFTIYPIIIMYNKFKIELFMQLIQHHTIYTLFISNNYKLSRMTVLLMIQKKNEETL